MKNLAIVAGACLLCSCSIGIKQDGSNTLNSTFQVAATYQEVYRRTDAFARQCHTSTSMWKGSFDVSGNLYQDKPVAEITISPRTTTGSAVARFEIAEVTPGSTSVTLRIWDAGRWDDRELAAAKNSISTGVISCRQ